MLPSALPFSVSQSSQAFCDELARVGTAFGEANHMPDEIDHADAKYIHLKLDFIRGTEKA